MLKFALTLSILVGSLLGQTPTSTSSCTEFDSRNGVQLTPGIAKVIKQLQGSGALVRVLVVDHAVISPLNMEVDREANCAEWSVNSERNPNIIALIVSTKDRNFSLFYGYHWDVALDAHWRINMTQAVLPFTSHDDWEGGIEAGLGSVHDLLAKAAVVDTAPTAIGWLIIGTGTVLLCWVISSVIGVIRRHRQRRRDAEMKSSAAVNYQPYSPSATGRTAAETTRLMPVRPTVRPVYDPEVVFVPVESNPMPVFVPSSEPSPFVESAPVESWSPSPDSGGGGSDTSSDYGGGGGTIDV